MKRPPSRPSVRIRVGSVTPFLWFDGEAEAAARFYASTFAGSRLRGFHYFGKAGPGKKGSVLMVEFEIAGQKLVALNGGPNFRLSPAFSLAVECRSQQEVDALWARLARGGKVLECGWLTDRFGVSWQIVPRRLSVLLSDKDPAKVDRVMAAVLKMKKIDLERLERAYRGR